MKRKFIRMICLATVAAMAFASCGKSEPNNDSDSVSVASKCDGTNHTFAEAWSSDDKEHWHAASCEHGENKSAKAAHVDVDQDGKCDVCAYEVGHTHTFADEWQSDENEHWHAATCLHDKEKGDVNKHGDADGDGVCDVCSEHVHVVDVYGFCSLCGAETMPIQEEVLGSVAHAAVGRANKVVGGSIEYSYVGENKTENKLDTQEHTVEFSLGTNGTYLKRTEPNEEGKTQTQEDWIKAVVGGEPTGVTVIKTEGQVTDAQPSSFSNDNLVGYYYAVSTFANGYGAENVLKSLFDASQAEKGVSDFKQTHDAEGNKYEFSFKSLIVNETQGLVQGADGPTGEEATVTNVHYYDVAVSFTYTDEYALTSLDIVCKCYTNDPGSSSAGLLEADVDFEYDSATGALNWKENPGADTYTIHVTQTVGDRGEIVLNDGSEYAPTDFTVQDDEGKEVTSLTLDVGPSTALNVVATPTDRYMSFIANSLNVTVKDKSGNEVKGLANLQGYETLEIWPNFAGEFVITLTYRNVVRTINVTVNGQPLGGAKSFEVTATDNNLFKDTYTFKAPAAGTYTFYLPYGVGAAKYTTVDKDGYPVIAEYYFDYQALNAKGEGSVTFQVTLMKGAPLNLTFMFRAKNITYTIGYDEPMVTE